MKYYVVYFDPSTKFGARFLCKYKPANSTFVQPLYNWTDGSSYDYLPGNIIGKSDYMYSVDELAELPSMLLAQLLTEPKLQLFDEDDFKELTAELNDKLGSLLKLLKLQADQDEDKGEDE